MEFKARRVAVAVAAFPPLIQPVLAVTGTLARSHET
jgi:hypothetical protein